MASIVAHTKAWIFFATALAASNGGGAASVQRISSHADFIDHNVPTDRELADAFSFLEQAGLILGQGNKYVLTPDGVVLYQQCSMDSASIYDTFNKLAAAFSGGSYGL